VVSASGLAIELIIFDEDWGIGSDEYCPQPSTRMGSIAPH
jgi:hypothetical protein